MILQIFFVAAFFLASLFQLNPEQDSPKKIIFSDMNANSYEISPTKIHYSPITVKESSSGIYSGGEEKTVKITKLQFQKLVELAEKVTENSEILLKKRTKPSCLVKIVSKNGNSSKFIIAHDAKEIKAFEVELKNLLK